MALYGVLGDIHGNREALAAVLDALAAAGVTRLLCVGDIVGYNADPDECVRLLRGRGAVAIRGNHDLIGTGALGFERCSNKAMHALKRTRELLGADTASYLRGLPATLPIEDDILLIHGGVRDVQQYMTQPRHIVENAGYLREDFPGRRVCFFGHTHEPRVFEVEGNVVVEQPVAAPVRLRTDRTYFINPGSVDASRKRAHKRAEYATLDSDARVVEFFDVPYDDPLTESKAEAGGFRLAAWRDRLYSMGRMLTSHSRDSEVV